MVKHQSDVTAVEYPERSEGLPKDAGEVLDLVVRKGPISLSRLMDQIHSMSQDAVFTRLSALRDAGYIDSVKGNIGEYGTTAPVWFVPKDD